MASEEEKQIIAGLEGEYHAVEWPWNKPKIVSMRHQVRDLVHSLGNEGEDFCYQYDCVPRTYSDRVEN